MTTTPVTLILPIRNFAAKLPDWLPRWFDGLNATKRPWEVIVVDDASTDGTQLKLDQYPKKPLAMKVLFHDHEQGFGACLRTALAEASHPLIAYCGSEYPYPPRDLAKLLTRLETSTDVPDIGGEAVTTYTPDLVSGCRTGVTIPGFWRVIGWCYRNFSRFGLGMPLEKAPSWYGVRGYLRSWYAWVVYGVPFHDPNSSFKVMRKSAIEKFPIQSDGDFVHIELVAKLTFLTSVLDEIPLSPVNQAIPSTTWTKADRKKVFRDPQFCVKPQGEVPAPIVETPIVPATA